MAVRWLKRRKVVILYIFGSSVLVVLFFLLLINLNVDLQEVLVLQQKALHDKILVDSPWWLQDTPAPKIDINDLSHVAKMEAELQAMNYNDSRGYQQEDRMEDLLIFNRVAKTGSEMMNRLIKLLSKENNFIAIEPPPKLYTRLWLPLKLEKQLAEYMVEGVEKAGKPGAYIGHHVAMVNFTRHSHQMPLHMNIVRDPVERVISWFYYVRQPIRPIRMKDKVLRERNLFPERKKGISIHQEINQLVGDPEFYKMDFETCLRTGTDVCSWVPGERNRKGDHSQQTLYFCTHLDNECLEFDSNHAAQVAKENVERYYAVVGIQEAMDVTLTVLEHHLPRFFANATSIYHDNKYSKKLVNWNKSEFRVPVSNEAKALVRKNFTNEMDFYLFCRQRLFRQYLDIINDKT